jgi:2-dehydropantoate 2-reductase
MLARAGAPVTLVGRPGHVAAIKAHGLRMETLSFDERVSADVSVDVASVAGADVILVAVKTVDTEEAARAIALHASPEALIVSLQNGVDNVERMRSTAGLDPVAAVVYVAVAMAGPGAIRHSGRGDLVLGDLPRSRPDRDLSPLARTFEGAGVPAIVSDDISTALWRKLVMNCAYNAVSALTRRRYGSIVAERRTREVVEEAVRETVRVGRRLGMALDETELLDEAIRLGRDAMPEATSSTAQDLARGRRTEIDSLNGLVADRGDTLGVPTPVNRTLHGLVKSLEQPEEE